MTAAAPGVGRTCARIVAMRTPSQVLSKRDQCVTQWMSLVRSSVPRARNCSQFHSASRSTSPHTRRLQSRNSTRGVAP